MAENDLDVTGVGHSVARIYEPVVESLQTVRTLARAFEAEIAPLEATGAPAQGPAADTTGREVLKALQDLCATTGGACASLRDAESGRDLLRLEAQCHHLKNSGRELIALSSLMLITAAGASDDFAVDSLVRELRELSSSLVRESDGIVVTICEVATVRTMAAHSLARAHRATEGHLLGMRSAGGPEADARQAPSSARTGQVRGMATALSRSVSSIMPRIVSCMQYPDAFSQRCDHVARIFGMGEDPRLSLATRAALSTLGCAQIRDMRQELDAIQKDACAALLDMVTASEATIVAFEDSLRSDTRLARMAERRDRLQDMRGSLENIKSDTDAALAELETCHTTFQGIQEAFERLNRLRAAVGMSSLNADLSERRSEKNAPQIRSVTKAIGDCAASCGQKIGALTAAFETLKGGYSGTDREELGRALGRVCAHLDAADHELEGLGNAVSAIRDAQASCAGILTRLAESARAAHARISANSQPLKELDRIAVRLEKTAGTCEDTGALFDSDVLQAAFGLYTIERERDVHRAILGDAAAPGGRAPSNPAPLLSDDDLLDAVLF